LGGENNYPLAFAREKSGNIIQSGFNESANSDDCKYTSRED
jgi:hypothetical protein